MTVTQPNLKLGRFEIVRELGRGAFGTVYLARDPQLERSVALKLPNVRFKERAGHEDRFLREARAAAGLHHPNIVPIHDAGQLGNHYYIAAAFIEGGTLRDILRSQGPPAAKTAVRLVARLADALGYAHAQGIVHRDVKPENVLLDSHGVPYLTDFGLARRLEEEQPTTEKRSLFGTPAYMSPEQAAGSTSGAPADQWALGIMLYELLTGQRPYEGDPLTVLYAIQHTDLSPPRSLVPDLSLDLQAICLKCLSRAPEDRYADCYALATDLQRWLADEPVQARPLTLPQRIYRWNQREPLIARLYGLLLLVVTVFGFVLTLLWLHANSEAAKSKRLELEAISSKSALQTTNGELNSEKEKLEANKRELEENKGELNKKIEELNQTVHDLKAAKEVAEANKRESEANKRESMAEQAKNSKLRYFGDVLGAGIAISTGQADRALTLLTESSPSERSIEWNFLTNLAHAIDQRYEHIIDLNSLKSEQTLSIISRHFPAAAKDEPHIRALQNAKDVLAVSDSAKRWLISKGNVDVLKQHLPPGTAFPRNEKYPNGPELKALDVVATEFGDKEIIARENATHAWLSPDGKRACFMVPVVEKKTIDELRQVISIRFQLSVVDLQAPQDQDQSLTLVQSTPTSYELPILLTFAGGIQNGYRVEIPDMQAEFGGAFSPDSTRFVLYNAQSLLVSTWDVSDVSPNEAGRQPTVNKSMQPYLTSSSAPCACHFNSAGIQLCIPDHLFELEAGSLTVQNDRKLSAVNGALNGIVFSRSGRHVAQLSSMTDNRNRTTRWLQINNCLTDNSQTFVVSPDRFTFCADVSRELKRAVDEKRIRLLMLDWKYSDLIDDADGEWISLRLANSTHLLFKKLIKPEPPSSIIWKNKEKRVPNLLKTSADDKSILLGYGDRFIVLKRENMADKWEQQINKELKDGALLDCELHAFQDSVLVCQPKGMTILSRSQNSKPTEFPLPFKSSLSMSSERTLAFLNGAGQLQLASVSNGLLGNSAAVHRSGSACMVIDPKRQMAAVATSERAISSVSLAKLVTEGTATTREIPQRLIINSVASLLCSIGSDNQVSLYGWPSLQRVATFSINDSVLYATPSNDGKRLIVVTSAGFQILDNQFSMPVLDTQKFAIPAVAAKVTTDQSAIFVYNREGQLLKYQL